MVRKQRKRISYVLPLANSAGGHRLGVNGLAVDSENSILYSGGRDGVICAWDLNLDLKRRASLYDSSNAPPSASYAPSISGQSHASIQSLARENSPAPSRSPRPPPTSSTLRHTAQAHTHWINDIALVHHNQALVSASSDLSVKLWTPSAFGQKSAHTLGLHGDYVKCLASPGMDSTWVASGGLDKRISLWDLTGAGEVLKINMADEGAPGAKGSVYALAATSNLIAAGGPESVVRVWDARSGRRVTKFVGHTDIIRSILVAEDGETVISASSDQTIKIWSLREGRCMYTLTMHNDSVWSLFSDDPRLSVFWSSDRSGLVAKTDTRGKSNVADGLCIGVAQEDSGVFKLVQAGGHIWTATASSSINRWNDVRTEDTDVQSPDSSSTQHRGSVATIGKARYHSNSINSISKHHGLGDSPRFASPSPARHNSLPQGVSFKSTLRLSNTAPIPLLRKPDVETATLHSTTSRRKISEAVDFDDGPFVPMRSSPEYTIEGQHGLVKHVMLNDKRRVLTLDTYGEVILWDLIQCSIVKSFGKQDIDDVLSQVNTMETVAHWCSVDMRTGCLTVVLEENNCFDAEMYADELELPEDIEFKEDQRINLGKWILRYLFDNLIDEEIQRDEDFRRKLFSTKYPNLAAQLERQKASKAPGSIQIPQTQITSWLDTSSTPTSASTLKPLNGTQYPQTPGMSIGLATPGGPNIPQHLRPNSPLAHPGEATPNETSSNRTSSERNSTDYFTSRPLSGGTQTLTPGTAMSSPVLNGRTSNENQSLTVPNTDADPTTPSPEKSGRFGKKFRGMNLIPKSFKKTEKPGDQKTPNADEQPSDSDSRNSQADDRLNEDSMVGMILRMRSTYEVQSRMGAPEKEVAGLNIQSPALPKESNGTPSLVVSTIGPALPNDTPVLKLPPQTIILIQEDNPDSGGVADLWEGTVGNVGREVDAVERVAPSWLGEVLLRNALPLKELVKVSFVLEPVDGLLPPVATDGNTRLNANRMLRARKILTYVADRIEPQPEQPDPDAMKPEEYLELYCQNQLIPPTMTLATIRTHVWRTGGDVLLYYKANGRKAIQAPRVTTSLIPPLIQSPAS